MNYSRLYDNPSESKVPGYENSVEKPVFMQGTQPVSLDDRSFRDREVPIYYQDEEEVKATVGSCLSMLLVQLIPIFGIVMLFKWAFTLDSNYVRRTFSKAFLIFYAIAGVVVLLGFLAARAMG